MFSTREKRSQARRHKSAHRQKLEDIVRLTHENMVGGTMRVEELPSRQILDSVREGEEQSWDEIVFRNRNKAYGAYVIRRGYNNNLAVGLFVTFVVVTFVLVYPILSKWFGSDDAAPMAPPKRIVYSELSAPPPIDKARPVPPSVQLPKLQKVIKFVPPKVVKDPVAEVPPTIAEIKEHKTAANAAEGPAEVFFDEPVEEVVANGEGDELFVVVDQQPEFEGGYEAMMAFVKQHMHYPANARRMQIEGTVHISFIVSKTGEISDVKVLRGIMTECDLEAVRVVKLMPRWKPGKQNGRNVNVRFILPLKFRLN